jgi:hypothetical protein
VKSRVLSFGVRVGSPADPSRGGFAAAAARQSCQTTCALEPGAAGSAALQ